MLGGHIPCLFPLLASALSAVYTMYVAKVVLNYNLPMFGFLNIYIVVLKIPFF